MPSLREAWVRTPQSAWFLVWCDRIASFVGRTLNNFTNYELADFMVCGLLYTFVVRNISYISAAATTDRLNSGRTGLRCLV